MTKIILNLSFPFRKLYNFLKDGHCFPNKFLEETMTVPTPPKCFKEGWGGKSIKLSPKAIFSAVVTVLLLLSSSVRAAEELMSIDAAIAGIFKDFDHLEQKTIFLSEKQLDDISARANAAVYSLYDREIKVYIVSKNGAVLGYALENTVKGKWGPIHYLLGVDPQGKIVNAVVLSYEENRGRPIAKARFLNQFRGKTSASPLYLRKDIQGITGATISSRAITDGIRKLLCVFEDYNH